MRLTSIFTVGVAAAILASCATSTGNPIQDFLADTRGKVVAWYRYEALIGYDYIDSVENTVISKDTNGNCVHGYIEIRDQDICYIVDDKSSGVNGAFACYEVNKPNGKYVLTMTSSSFDTLGIPVVLTAKTTDQKALSCN